MKLEQLKELGWKDEDLIALIEELLEKMKSDSQGILEDVRCEEVVINSDDLCKRVSELLKRVGIPFNLKGKKYLMTAIIYCVETGKEEISMTKELYPMIAKSHDTTPSRVERAIRHACDKCFNSYIAECDRIFGNTINSMKGKPTNQEFIAMLVDYILHGYDLY